MPPFMFSHEKRYEQLLPVLQVFTGVSSATAKRLAFQASKKQVVWHAKAIRQAEQVRKRPARRQTRHGRRGVDASRPGRSRGPPATRRAALDVLVAASEETSAIPAAAISEIVSEAARKQGKTQPESRSSASWFRSNCRYWDRRITPAHDDGIAPDPFALSAADAVRYPIQHRFTWSTAGYRSVAHTGPQRRHLDRTFGRSNTGRTGQCGRVDQAPRTRHRRTRRGPSHDQASGRAGRAALISNSLV